MANSDGEGDIHVGVNVEAEVEAVGDVHGEVQTEVEGDGFHAHHQGEVEREENIHVGVNVEGRVEAEAEPEVEVVGDVEGEVQADVEADEYNVRSWNASEEDELTDHGDEVEFDIFEGTNQEEIGGPRGLSESDWESDTLNSVVESDNTDDDRDGYGDFGIFSMPKSMENYKWVVGTYFPQKKDFTEAIRTYGVENGRKLKVYKNDKKRVRVKCCGVKGNCTWYAYCAYKASQHTWQLRKIIDNHTCSREFNIRLMTSKWLSGRLEKTIKENPSINLYNLQNKVSKKWNIGVSRSTTCRAKAMAFKQIEGDFKEQYKRLYDYANELLRSNPGSTVKLHVEANEDNPIFKRLYVCLKACKDRFISCRPIIGLDGCFLKGKYGGELLTAVARYGNEQMCPLVYAVVEVENKDNWTWFLQLLIDDLGGVEGLVPALQELLPGVEQRFCVRHIYANFRKKFPGQLLKHLLWKAASSTHPQAWEAVMREIKDVNADAFKYLLAIPPRFWSRSRFTGKAVCDTLVNNMSEAFNSVILSARGKPIITMMEDIRIWSGLKLFEIRHTSTIGEKFVVDIDKLECSCRKWTVSRIPCCHALTAMSFLNMNGEDYISHWFRRSTYQETYIPIIYPVNDPQLWEITLHHDVLPLPKRVLPGRPKKKRRLEPWELKKDDTQLK
ncbi:uncharacterized protein LOC106760551 [Vigna radiata var. radiata]|uniref:Uncharacterized protein LOC106760551 n=1 Tax=Vigna radiata var. radiata TaxID=3916 RepID=A0A1S3U0C2_VIGRR|nr:uncharacterized protein LOC106760551 [Vigna radiata var. radiata]